MQGSAANTIQAAGGSVVDNDDVVDALNDLLESCRDGEYGFNTAAEHAKSADIKTSHKCQPAGSA